MTNRANLILNTDSYKPSHFLQYPPQAETTSFYVEARAGQAIVVTAVCARDRGRERGVSTAGLRKPAAEIYPAPAFLAMCLEAGVPVALSSDAHRPEDVGADYERALELLGEMGVAELAVFERRSRSMAPIGRA